LVAPALAGPGAPSIRVTFNGIDEVTARVVVLRLPSNRVVARIPLGSVRVGRSISVPWRAGALRAGRYVVRVHAHDQWNRQLRRLARASGKALLVVHGVHKVATPPPPPPVTSSSGVFPVNGWHQYGSPFGEQRKGYRHQGQDILAPRGTPIVAPTGGTISFSGYQASAAGEYVVETAANGYAYFFAHCIRHSTVVSAGQAVAAGTAICSLGATGDATGPHLHFEVWTGGWRTSSASKPIDPLPLLKAWDTQG
jgi:murein DD-endopeptidase MepM/ murein hydrolase activator NlpD